MVAPLFFSVFLVLNVLRCLSVALDFAPQRSITCVTQHSVALDFVLLTAYSQ